MHHVLLVEDDPGISGPLKSLLADHGYEVSHASTVADAQQRLTPAVSLVVLDWRLPDGDGVDLLARWRADGCSVPVIILSARAELLDRVLGLEHGADDYLTKPFEPRELLARIRARLRRHLPATRVRVGGVQIDTASRSVQFQGEEVDLTRMEFALLAFGLNHPHQVFGRDELLCAVWGYSPTVASRTVDTHVRQLRAKLTPELIETVRSVGYRFCP